MPKSRNRELWIQTLFDLGAFSGQKPRIRGHVAYLGHITGMCSISLFVTIIVAVLAFGHRASH